jgi:hypothetical protein
LDRPVSFDAEQAQNLKAAYVGSMVQPEVPAGRALIAAA